MSRRHRPSRADRKPVTRRYVARVVERARQDIVRAIVTSERLVTWAAVEAPDSITAVPERRWDALFPPTTSSRSD